MQAKVALPAKWVLCAANSFCRQARHAAFACRQKSLPAGKQLLSGFAFCLQASSFCLQAKVVLPAGKKLLLAGKSRFATVNAPGNQLTTTKHILVQLEDAKSSNKISHRLQGVDVLKTQGEHQTPSLGARGHYIRWAGR